MKTGIEQIKHTQSTLTMLAKARAQTLDIHIEQGELIRGAISYLLTHLEITKGNEDLEALVAQMWPWEVDLKMADSYMTSLLWAGAFIAEEVGYSHVLYERQRQLGEEGWTAQHDAQHTDQGLTRVALAYLALALLNDEKSQLIIFTPEMFNVLWPKTWDRLWLKRADYSRYLEKAGALVAAEIDRVNNQA